MATKKLTLAPTTGIGSMVAVTISPSLAIADIAAINSLIVDDQKIVSSMAFGASAATIQAGIFANCVSTTTLSTLTSTSIAAPSTATITAITAGMFVSGFGIAPNTFVVSATGTTITMNQAPTTGQTAGYFTFTASRPRGWFDGKVLQIPNRGDPQILLNGDVVGVDPSGWVVVLSKNAINWPGSPWSLV